MRNIRTESPDNIRIDGRQARHRIIWSTDPWLFLRLLFLSHPENSLCVWCGNVASVIEHPTNEFYGTPAYLDFTRCGCIPMCVPCNGAKRRGKVLCSRCRRQGHYVYPGEICWSCKPKAEKEHLIYGKEQRQRDQNKHQQKRYRKYHPKKEVRDGKWVTVGKAPQREKEHRKGIT